MLHFVSAFQLPLKSLLNLVSCGVPTPPGNGSIAPIPNILEGAEVSFGCNEGFVPTGQRMAMCRTTGNWTPDPADLVCTRKILITG